MEAALGSSKRVLERVLRPGPPSRLAAYAALAAGSFVCFILAHSLDGTASTLFAVGGVSACGWSWLLTRALFDPAPHDLWWPRVVAMLLATAGVVTVLAPAGGVIARLGDTIYGLTGSAALLLTFVEPFSRYRPDLPINEKRFRFLFLGVYTALIGISILGLRAAYVTRDALPDDLIKSACASIGLGAAVAAVWFRLRNPLASPRTSPSKRAPTAEDAQLAGQILSLLREEEIDKDPDLRLAGLAARLGQPEYKVSQCISAELGFPNFNRLINHHRIERAKRLLADPGSRRPILEVAFDCGFGSVGPFNRSFKDEVGVTPRAFRMASRHCSMIAPKPVAVAA